MAEMSRKKEPKDTNNKQEVIAKYRYWTLVVYPESAPADWQERLQMTGLPFFVSPLHDKDTNPNGEPKKAHFHVCVCYSGPTTYNNVKRNITEPLGQPIPMPVQSVKGLHRYFTHQDNPEKYQYDKADIKNFNGFCIDDYEQMTFTDENRIYEALEDIIYQNNIDELWKLVKFLKENGQTELLSFLRRNTYYIKELISSLRHSGYFQMLEQMENDYEVNQETGEIIEK